METEKYQPYQPIKKSRNIYTPPIFWGVPYKVFVGVSIWKHHWNPQVLRWSSRRCWRSWVNHKDHMQPGFPGPLKGMVNIYLQDKPKPNLLVDIHIEYFFLAAYGIMTGSCCVKVFLLLLFFQQFYNFWSVDTSPFPVGSMGLVHLPTWIFCSKLVGKYTRPMDHGLQDLFFRAGCPTKEPQIKFETLLMS